MKSVVPQPFCTRDWFHGRRFFNGRQGAGGTGDGFCMTQVRYIQAHLLLYGWFLTAPDKYQSATWLVDP